MKIRPIIYANSVMLRAVSASMVVKTVPHAKTSQELCTFCSIQMHRINAFRTVQTIIMATEGLTDAIFAIFGA